jgi:hypothetical protein
LTYLYFFFQSKSSSSTSDRDRHKDKHHRRDREKEKDKTGERSLSRSASARDVSVAVSSQRLAPALPAVKLTTQLRSTPEAATRFIEVTVSETENLSVVKVINGDKIQWEDQVRAKACLLTANEKFSALAFTDNSLQLYSPSGRRVRLLSFFSASPQPFFPLLFF